MSGNLMAPKIGHEELLVVCRRIMAIYHRVRALEDQARTSGDPDRMLAPTAYIEQPLRSRLEAVDSALAGLRYAVWCIGETLMATGGIEAMHQAMALIEDQEGGTRISSWLDHRWNEVTDGRDIWVA